MLDTETKSRIDSARDILVGKIPDPKAQVEQITTALIYKFMDDMDKESVELGGKPQFFTDGFGEYAWSKLMNTRLGGYDRMNLYVEAITKMSQNPHIPTLFRTIFKDAFLPYRDPETLNLFLKEINGFIYDHSERLGDAFEYLLSILGSQGEAGQFRTPRHIIDFMVEIIAPDKNDTILDPACGTAGFLISSFKHIMNKNKKNKPGDLLNTTERKNLMKNTTGYDISPDMVRISLVNMYLHGFPEPNISEYDTLTYEDRWDDMFDVILANPPFMSPKGGIRPHKRFSVQAKRSEVLFVDYIAEHLLPTGRAAVIVPEGIIFQSGTAYKQLRKMLVENYLFGVVSLPAGVFNPYSGVKTSILLMDKTLTKRTDKIIFVKVENDGFDLGAQRRPINKNDLPEALNNIQEYVKCVREGKEFSAEGADNILVVEKEKIGENGEWNLSGERYRESFNYGKVKFPMVGLGEKKYFTIESGGTPDSKKEEYWNGDIRWVTLVDLPSDDIISKITMTQRTITKLGLQKSSAKLLPIKTVLVSSRATIGRIGIAYVPLATNQGFKNIIINDFQKIDAKFVAMMLIKLVPQMEQLGTGGTYKEISKTVFSNLQIPLPPLEIQKEIVAEIESYQKIIDGARQVVENYKPQIQIDPEWEMVELSSIFKNLDGKRIPITKSDRKPGHYPYYGASGVVDYVENYIFNEDLLLISEDGANLLARATPIAFSVSGKIWVNNHAHVLKFLNIETQKFVELYINSINIENYVTGAAQPKLNQKALNSIKIPLPGLETQNRIVSQIEKEQQLVNANKELMTTFEQKVKDRIARVWGE